MRALIFVSALLLLIQRGSADSIECDNGDRYNGKVISMDEKVVTLQNEIAGKISIPRQRIVSISFRDAKTAPVVAQIAPPVSSTNVLNPQARAVQFDPAAVQRIQNELLATATPETSQMFNEMIQGLMGGQMNIGDIRNKAQTTLQELRDLQKELGDDETAALLNSYGAILENFLQQSARTTNTVAAPKAQRPRVAP